MLKNCLVGALMILQKRNESSLATWQSRNFMKPPLYLFWWHPWSYCLNLANSTSFFLKIWLWQKIKAHENQNTKHTYIEWYICTQNHPLAWACDHLAQILGPPKLLPFSTNRGLRSLRGQITLISFFLEPTSLPSPSQILQTIWTQNDIKFPQEPKFLFTFGNINPSAQTDCII